MHHEILIVGAGTAGITVAARLKKRDPKADVALIDPAEWHYYQPAWTLVGAGAFSYEKTRRPMRALIPRGVTWYRDAVIALDPDRKQVVSRDGRTITYDYLVLCPGIQIDPTLVEGLAAVLDQDDVVSVYTDPRFAWDKIRTFQGGTALFTQPATPIKCGGAPQKIMYLADDYWRRTGVRSRATIVFATPGTVIFGVPDFRATLEKVLDRKDIMVKFYHDLVRVDGAAKVAWYRIKTAAVEKPALQVRNAKLIREEKLGEDMVGIHYDLMHVAPPQAAPEFVRRSKLACPDGPHKGWACVDPHTLQHERYDSVFALGDVAALPTAKTGAAVRKQAPVVVENIMRLRAGRTELWAGYNGYSSCPLVTGYGKMVLAEFEYGNRRASDPLISKFVDTTKENYSMWLLKKYGLPFLYWHLMLKGRA